MHAGSAGRLPGNDTAGGAASLVRGSKETLMIRKLKSGLWRLYSKKKDPKTGKRKNLGTFKTRKAAEDHERAIQFFKRR